MKELTAQGLMGHIPVFELPSNEHSFDTGHPRLQQCKIYICINVSSDRMAGHSLVSLADSLIKQSQPEVAATESMGRAAIVCCSIRFDPDTQAF